jgi:RHS repeat-associated protein
MFSDKNADGKIDITTTASTEVLQENHYYPFGMNMSGPWQDDAAARNNQYQYNGKELNEDFGLGLYDYGARWYDASLGRWWSPDPLAEKYRRWSGYNYGMDNPVRFIDPDGMQIIGSDGKPVTYETKDDGTIAWSNNADKSIIGIGNALLKTKRGTKSLEKMMSSKTEISLKLTSKALDGGVHGSTQLSKKTNEDGSAKSAKIVISTAKTGDRFDMASDEETINAVAVHESFHATDKEQIEKDDKQPNGFETERTPVDNEYEARIEYNMQYGGDPSKFKDYYEKENPQVSDKYGNIKPSYYGVDQNGKSRTKSRYEK